MLAHLKSVKIKRMKFGFEKAQIRFKLIFRELSTMLLQSCISTSAVFSLQTLLLPNSRLSKALQNYRHLSLNSCPPFLAQVSVFTLATLSDQLLAICTRSHREYLKSSISSLLWLSAWITLAGIWGPLVRSPSYLETSRIQSTFFMLILFKSLFRMATTIT